jgi:hypothetical protein
MTSGTITGGIDPCFGLAADAGSTAFVAGTVDVFAGSVPTAGAPAITTQAVRPGGTYRFRLPLGTYVLVGHWSGSNLRPPTATATLSTGQTVIRNLSYVGECK